MGVLIGVIVALFAIGIIKFLQKHDNNGHDDWYLVGQPL